MVSIDPNQDLLLSKISWPLALRLVDDQGNYVGQADYVSYYDVTNRREITYMYGAKKLILKVKLYETVANPIDDPNR